MTISCVYLDTVTLLAQPDCSGKTSNAGADNQDAKTSGRRIAVWIYDSHDGCVLLLRCQCAPQGHPTRARGLFMGKQIDLGLSMVSGPSLLVI